MDIQDFFREVDANKERQARIEYLETLQEKEMKTSLAHMKSAERKSNIALAISIAALIATIIGLIK